jgi:hypothetical protein
LLVDELGDVLLEEVAVELHSVSHPGYNNPAQTFTSNLKASLTADPFVSMLYYQ